MDAYDAVLAFWLSLTSAALLSPFLPVVSSAANYGKLSPSTRHHARHWLLSPSFYGNNGRAFTLYYLVAASLNAVMLAVSVQWLAQRSPPSLVRALLGVSKGATVPPSLPLVHALLQCQTLRRLYECRYVHRFSDSAQHALLTVIGVSYYAGVVLTPVIDAAHRLETVTAGVDDSEPWLFAVRACLSVALFAAASHWQHCCHVYLAELRGRDADARISRVYVLPTGGSFATVCCPHYTAEILIYVSLCLLRPTVAQLLVLAWVVANLAVTAIKTRHWYRTTFQRDTVPRFAILPGVL